MEVDQLKVFTEHCLSKLPTCVLWQLLSYMDTDTTVALAGVNIKLRKLVGAKSNLNVSLPLSATFSNHLKLDTYSQNKPILRLKISHLSPDYIRVDKMLNSRPVHHLPISRQLLFLNLSNLTHLCLHLELTMFGDIHSYRIAFLAMLQCMGVLKKLYKLHLTVHHSFFLNLLPENFSSWLMKDALTVEKLVVSILEHRGNNNEYRMGLENFFSLVESKTFILKIFHEPADNKCLILINDHVECFHLVAPCQFQALVDMRCVTQLTVFTSDSQCPLHQAGHRLGYCVLAKEMVFKGCPQLKIFNGMNVEELQNMEPCVENVQRRRKCGECEVCRKPDCEKCVHYQDMKKYGGAGKLRQACQERKGEGIIAGDNLEEETEEVAGIDFPTIGVVDWFQFIRCTVD